MVQWANLQRVKRREYCRLVRQTIGIDPRDNEGPKCALMSLGSDRAIYAADRFRWTEPLMERRDGWVDLPAASHSTRKARLTEAESGNTFDNSGSTRTRFVPAMACL